MVRTLRSELIDTLPHDHPESIASRRDLVLINRLMGNWQWILRALVRAAPSQARVLEIGAGAGEFVQWSQNRRKRLGRADITWTCLDQAPRPKNWPGEQSWLQADLLTFGDYAKYEVVIANLTLHHFTTNELQHLGAHLRSGPRLVIAAEPARHAIHMWQAWALRLLGVNRVTRHDASASVAAGFRRHELPEVLGLTGNDWNVAVQRSMLGSYRMLAQRHDNDRE